EVAAAGDAQDLVAGRQHPAVLAAGNAADLGRGPAARVAIDDRGEGLVAVDELARLGPLDRPLRVAQPPERLQVVPRRGRGVLLNDLAIACTLGHVTPPAPGGMDSSIAY